uniref:Uncharacterized protein n=1 Tax=Trichogramma kaykai TaxID=54128 RepID=A0ABD2VT94_9HYME
MVNYIDDHSEGIPLIEFVIKTGYEDELIIDENGEPLLGRTTAVHYVSRQITLPTTRILDEDEDGDRKESEPSTDEDEDGDRKQSEPNTDEGEDGDREESEPSTDKDEDGDREESEPNTNEDGNGDREKREPSTDEDEDEDEDGDKEERKPNHDELCKYFDIAHTLFKIYNRFEANYIDDANNTHFHVACMTGCHIVVERFLELGQDPNCGYESIEPPLHLAVDFAHQRVTESLLRSDTIDPNIANSIGLTALHIICVNYGDQYDLAKLFFDINEEKLRKVQVNAKDKWGETPMQLALKFDKWKLVKLLLRRGAEPYLDHNDGGPSCLHVICDPADDDLVEGILTICGEGERLVPLDGTDKLGNTPLHLAMQHGNKRVALWLLEEGANPNVPNAKGLTPLHIICMRDSDDPELARMLIELSNSYYHPVQIEAKDKFGRRPIDFAVDNNNDKLAQFLWDRGSSSDGVESRTAMNIMVTMVVVQLIVYWMMHRWMRGIPSR